MENERIVLRPWRESDAEALYKYASDPDVGPRAGWPPHKSVDESLEIIRTVFNNDTTWAIVWKVLSRNCSFHILINRSWWFFNIIIIS